VPVRSHQNADKPNYRHGQNAAEPIKDTSQSRCHDRPPIHDCEFGSFSFPRLMAAVSDAQNASSIASNRLRSVRSLASRFCNGSLTFRPIGTVPPEQPSIFTRVSLDALLLAATL